MCDTISHEHPWEIIPDLYFSRDSEDTEKEEQATTANAVTKGEFQGRCTAPAPEFTATHPEASDWSGSVHMPSVPTQQVPLKTGVLSPPLKTGPQLPWLRPPDGYGTTTKGS